MTVSVSPARSMPLMALLAVTLTLTGCAILPKSETLAVYQLPAATAVAQPQTKAEKESRMPMSLRIATPYSSQIIDSERVLVVPQGSQLSAYSGVRWSDPAPILVRNRLAGAFRTDGRLASISIDHAAALDPDFELAGDLVAFQAIYENGEPVVRIQYDAMLIHSTTHRSLATHRFDISEPVHGTQTPEVIEAFGRASDRLADEVVEWTIQAMKASARGL